MDVKRMIRFDGEGSLKAWFDLEQDGLLVRGCRVIKGKQGLFVRMPRMQGKDGQWYETVSLRTKELVTQVEQAAREAYRNME